MNAWILIIATHVSYGAVVHTQEFDTLVACQSAGKIAVELVQQASSQPVASPHFQCVHK